MTLDPMPTDWALCTIEDASAPDQVFPCMWDAQREGNGQGCSFVMDFAGDVPHYVTDVLADGSILTSDTSCAPYSGDEGFTDPAPSPEPVLTAPTGEPVAQVLASPAPADELAHTGVDPTGWLVAAVMLTAGIAMVRARKRARA
jgi:hypothetical protein